MDPFYKPTSIDERAREYLSTIGATRTRETAENAIKAFYSFRRFHSPAPLAWKQMDMNVLTHFSNWLVEHHYNDLSRRTYLSCLTEFLKYALDKEWLPANFSFDRAMYRKRKSIERMSYPIPEPSPRIPELIAYYDHLPLPQGDEWKEMIKRLTILRARAVVHALYASAGRVSEVASLQRKQVQDGRIAECVITGKGKRQRYIFLTSEAQRAIQVYCAARNDAYEPLFISHARDRGKALSRATLWKIVDDAAKAIGIQAHPHDFRHFRARQMLEQGERLEMIQEILGHEDISTTRKVYAHFDKKQIRAGFDRSVVPVKEALRSE